jgi:hypothetical protein
MTTDQPIPLDKMAGVYIKIRAKIAEITKAYDNEVEQLKAQQSEVAGVMKDILKEMGMRSVNTVAGTVILTEKTRYFPTDWSQFKEFIKENNLIDLMEKRIAQGNMAAYLVNVKEAKDRGETLPYPAGMQSETELTVSVRKPT